MCRLPHVVEVAKKDNLEFDEAFADIIFWTVKSFVMEVIWGEEMQEFFPKLFKKVCGDKLQQISIPATITIEKFEEEKDQFDLFDKFSVTFDDASSFVCVLQEEELIKMLYHYPTMCEALGREFCIIFDIFYAKAGTEAIAESFYRVMGTQEQDDGQSQEVLTMRTKLVWCLPSVLQCERALNEIAKLYIEGDKTLGLKIHFVPIYKDARSMKTHSIVMERLIKTPARLPFLV